MLFDAFICHASEDKESFVRPLAKELAGHHLEIWYDEFTLGVGDSLREAIDKGLAQSRFGIVVLSQSFFDKPWPNRELNGLVARATNEDRSLILPVWYNLDYSDVVKFSPPLADTIAARVEWGMERVVTDLLAKIRPETSPLIVARDFLISKGKIPPVITDEWWLDIIEIKEGQFLFPDTNLGWRWIFPLPYKSGAQGIERGLNIAWSALQYDWASYADNNITQLSHPDLVHEFIYKWPGLRESVEKNPELLALYAPQITISGFDGEFSNLFDFLLEPSQFKKCESLRYSRPRAIDGSLPECGDFIAWRHPTYGNYSAADLSYEFVHAHTGSYLRGPYGGIDCLVWLLSDASEWMPTQLREKLIEGFRDRADWWISRLYNLDITEYIDSRIGKKILYTRKLIDLTQIEFENSLINLNLKQSIGKMIDKAISYDIYRGCYNELLYWHENINKKEK